jgi:hypothetical protein
MLVEPYQEKVTLKVLITLVIQHPCRNRKNFISALLPFNYGGVFTKVFINNLRISLMLENCYLCYKKITMKAQIGSKIICKKFIIYLSLYQSQNFLQ